MNAAVALVRSRTSGLKVGGVVLAIGLIFGAISMQVGRTSDNADITILCFVVLAMLTAMLWRPGEPPVLLFAAAFQWLQVATKTLHANFVGASLDQFMPWAPAGEATVIGLFGLLAISGGVAVGAGPVSADLDDAARGEASRIRITRLIQMHIGVLLAIEGLFALGNLGGLQQVVGALSQLRFATLFALGFVVITRRQGISWFALLVAFEVLNSLGGFFAGFRMPVYVAFLAVATTMRQLTPPRVAAALLLAIGALYLGIVWQAIKGEYRDIASQGSGAQVVELDRGEQFEALTELWGDANGDLLSSGVQGLAQRLAYVDLLAYTVQFVPNTREHADGEVWAGALRHILVPRLVWPEKPDLQPDTEFTREFTGLGLLSAKNDTSISIGYVGDAYIDFGQPVMYGFLFLLGLAFGWLYRALLRLRRGLVTLRFGIVVAVFLVLANFEITAAKLLGGLLTPWLVGYFGSRLFLAEISRWIVFAPKTEGA